LDGQGDQGSAAVVGLRHLEPLAAENQGDQQAGGFQIIDNEEACGHESS
jgi:hypothetical protein